MGVMLTETPAPCSIDLVETAVRPGRDESRYNYRCGVHELVLVHQRISRSTIRAVAEGGAEFALVVDEPLVWLCYRFGEAIPWGAALFDHEPSRREADLPPPGGSPLEQRGLLHVDLIDAADLSLKATRNVTLWLDFTRSLNESIRDLSRYRFDPHERRRAMLRLHRQHSSVDAFVAKALARCRVDPCEVAACSTNQRRDTRRVQRS